MGNVIKQQLQGMSWLTQTGLVLLLTLATTIFMSDGLVRPTGAEASVVAINNWPATPQVVSNTSAATATGAVTVSAGANRVMLVAVGAEYTAVPTSQRLTVTYGGKSVQQLGQNFGATGTIWLGVVTEADLAAAVGTTLSVTNNTPTNLTAMYASAAVFSGVDQVNIISGINTASSNTAVTTMALPSINVKGAVGNSALSFYISNRNVQASTPDAAYTETAEYLGTNFYMAFNTLTTAVTSLTTTAPVSNTPVASSGSAVSVALVPFGVTGIGIIGTCGGCHFYPGTSNPVQDGTARNNPIGEFPGSHVGHVTTANMVCTQCHYDNTDHNHSTGFKNITGSSLPGNSYVPGKRILTTPTPGFGVCNNTFCHGTATASPTWGVTTTNASCTKCHGKKVAQAVYSTVNNWQSAPGYGGTGTDLAGASSSADQQVGAHDTHLRALNNISARITCNQCHIVPATSASVGHIDTPTPAEVTFGGTAVAGSGTTPTYAGGSFTCNNTYCHYGRSPYPPATTLGAVVWNNSTYLSGTITLTGDCGKCHQSPPTNAGSHSGVNNINQCNGCHSHVNTSGVFTNPALHVDGIVQAQGCSNCHGWPPTTNAHTIHINNIIAEKALGSLPGGFVGNQVCGTCHNVTALSKHAGDATSDGTSRNIFLPSPSTLQASYQFGPSAVTFSQSLTTCSNISCHFGDSTAWGDPPTTTCQACHGYPPVTTLADPDNKHVAGATPVNHIGVGASVNTKTTFNSTHGGCVICHGTQDSGTGTQAPHANYVVATQHNSGNINMNGPTTAPSSSSTQYDSVTRGCNAACHANDATHRMTASAKTITYGQYGGGGDCISCHTVAQASPIAQALNGTVTQRLAVVGSFSLASRHIRSRTSPSTVQKEDCCVCHMEGDVATGSPNGTYHKNGYIELRDPDLGTTIKGVTHSGTTAAAGVYTSTATDARPVRFSRNLASATIEPDTAAIMINHCLKCHDAAGATNSQAQLPGAMGGSALKPFGATVAANPGGGVLDVNSQFASTNRSFHPVLVRTNNGYTNTGGTRMVAPWNGVAKTATTTVYGPLITCWDCHAPNAAAGTITTSGVHGGTPNGTDAVQLRGNVYTNSATATTGALNLCINCHVVTGNTTNHGTGSAIFSNTNGSMTYFSNRCYFCHSSANTNAKPARPIPAGDIHGFTTYPTGTAIPAADGYAFMRRSTLPHSVRNVAGAASTPSCGNATGICNQNMGGYTPGGVY